MSKERPKTPKRRTDAKAHGRKNHGHRSQGTSNRTTEHECGLCRKRKLDEWGKPPRHKYGIKGSPNRRLLVLHPSCASLYPKGA